MHACMHACMNVRTYVPTVIPVPGDNECWRKACPVLSSDGHIDGSLFC